MLHQATLLDIPSATSSPGSARGPGHYVVRDGPTPDRYGQGHALVSLSARQAKEMGLMTSGTYGRRSSISLRPSDLSASLVSRLRPKPGCCGSILYKLTWKERAMPSGRRIFALRGSMLRTSGKDCTGWPTPRVSSSGGFGSPDRGMDGRNGRIEDTAQLCGWQTPKASEGMGRYGVTNGKVYPKLWGEAELAGWPTPTGTDAIRFPALDAATKNVTLNHAANLAGWPTPAGANAVQGAEDILAKRSRNSQSGLMLTDVAESCLGGKVKNEPLSLGAWATPAARDYRFPNLKSFAERGGGKKGEQLCNQVVHSGPIANGCSAETGKRGQLNPAHSRWLMGLPEEWCACAVMATPLSRRKRKPS